MSSPTLPGATPTLPPPPPESPLEQFLEKNFKKLIIGALLVVAAVVIATILRHRSNEAAFAAAVAATQAKTPEDCDLVVVNHPGTVAAGNALITKARLLWEANKKDSSVAVLSEFVASYNKHPLHVQGISTLATRQENLGKLDEASKLYEQILADYPNEDLAGLAKLRLGDILWQQGKEAEAKKIYEEFPRSFPGSPWFEDNQSRLEWIAAALPTKEVEAPKPPPAPPASLKAPDAPPAPPTATMTPAGTAVTTPAIPAPTIPPIKLGNGATSVPVTVPTPPSTTPNSPKTADGLTPPPAAPPTTTPPAPPPPPPAPEKPAADPK